MSQKADQGLEKVSRIKCYWTFIELYKLLFFKFGSTSSNLTWELEKWHKSCENSEFTFLDYSTFKWKW